MKRRIRVILEVAIVRLLLVVILALTSQAQAGDVEADKVKRVEVLQSYMETELSAFEGSLKAAKPEPVTRDLAAAALAEVMLFKDIAKAQGLLEKIFQMQEVRVNSPDYGDVPWQMNHSEIKDPNGIQFTMLSLAPLFIKYGDQFPKEFQAEARPHLQGALYALQRKKVAVSYTNIFLMKLSNEILLGEYLGDKTSIATGVEALKEWMRFTRDSGITEYDSAVYAGVQLTVLHTLYSTTKSAAIRNLAGVALEYLWTDAVANYFGPAEALSGSSSRTYSFLFHDLNLNLYYYLFGIQQNPPGRVAELSAEVLTWANGVWGGYAPPEELRNLATQPTRVVRQKTGSGPGQDRYNFITPSFSLGSSSFFYEHQDREIALLFNSPKKLPALSVVLDPFSAPYGKVKILEGKGGHYKIMHLRNSISSVQDGGAVLALMDLASEAGRKIGGSVGTNIVFPLDTDGLFLNGKPFQWSKEAVKIPSDSVMVLREGRAAVAVRIFKADGAMDGYPLFFLRNDGVPYKAARLVAYHARGDQGMHAVEELRSGVLVLAAECESDEAFTKFLTDAQAWKVEEQEDHGIWSATASGPSLSRSGETNSLSAALDIARRVTANRQVNGKPYKTAIFSVNDEDRAAIIWGRISEILEPVAKPKEK